MNTHTTERAFNPTATAQREFLVSNADLVSRFPQINCKSWTIIAKQAVGPGDSGIWVWDCTPAERDIVQQGVEFGQYLTAQRKTEPFRYDLLVRRVAGMVK